MAIFLKTTELAKVAFLARQGPYEQIPEALGELRGWAKEKRYTLVGAPVGTFFDGPGKVPPEELKWEVAWGIAEDAKEVEPEEKGTVGIKVMRPVKVAATYHKGPYKEIPETYQGLFKWLFRNNYEVAGPAREIWWSDPGETRQGEFLTELQVPVKKR